MSSPNAKDMPSYNIQDGNEGFKRFKVNGSGTDDSPYIPVMSLIVQPNVTSVTGWSNPVSDASLVSEKIVKETIDNQEVTAASFNTADGVLTLTKTDGNITVDLDGRYLTTITSIDADVVTVSNLEVDNFKSSAIVTEAEGIANNDNDTTIPTSAAVKDYVDNTVIPDTNTYITNASFNTADGVLTLTLNDASTVTVDLDGRFLQNVVEDTTPQLGGNLDLNSNDITGTGDIDITGEITATTLIGNMRGATIFKAKAGEALTKGAPVYISGDDLVGNQPVVSIADADDVNKMPCFGLANETVSLNANVNVVTFGTITGLDTSSFNQGDILYISTTGTLTATKPTGESSLIQNIGKVMRSHASAGSIKVGGAGRTNDVPNLNNGNVFIGNASNQAETRGLTLDDIAQTATNKHFTASDETKLDGIADNATANETNAYLTNRANHTGTQPHTSITGLGTAATHDVGTGANNVVAYDSSGNVGIGTTTPTQKLDVHGSIKIKGNTPQDFSDFWASGGDNAAMFLPYGYIGSSGGYGLSMYVNGYRNNDGGFTYMGINGHSDTSAGIDIRPQGDIVFSTGTASGTSLPVRMKINASGNVGIGTTSPSYKLHVNGSVGATSYTTTSDEKLKENIQDIPIELIDEILRINIKSFNFIDDDKKITQYGVIAQELEDIEKDLKLKNIDVQLVNTDDYRQDFESEDEIDKFLVDKPYLEATKTSEKYTVQEDYFIFKGKEYKSLEDAQKIEGVLKEGQQSKIEKKQRDVEKTKYIASWTQKAVNYNNLFIIQQALLSDVLSVLKTQDLLFSVDDIKTVVRDKFTKTLEVETKDGNIVKSIEENKNTQHKRVLAWVAKQRLKDPNYKIPNKVYSVDDVLRLIKKETNKRIRTIDGRLLSQNEWLQKSQNYQDIKNTYLTEQVLKALGQEDASNDAIPKKDYDFATRIIERKDAFVKHYRTFLKPKISKMSSTELQSFDPFDASNWEGLEC